MAEIRDDEAGTAGRAGEGAKVIGVLGAGTMGSGIAQLGARSGARTVLYDPIAEALDRGLTRAHEGLQKEAAKGRLDADAARAAAERLTAVGGLAEFADCDLVIEAAPERIELKHELYRALAEVVSSECVLASNTSSLPVTKIASGVEHPERVVGMHFFNPAPIMKLLEIIAGALSNERSLELADATGRAMGKDTIRASDGPGFLVNRCNRPFGLEALRLLGERIADVETIDRIMRMAGGFPMGPFELSDLVGVDTGFDISQSFYELSFGEPRWRPSPIQARQVAAGLYGRKAGRGYYDYSDGPKNYRGEDPKRLQVGTPVSGEGVVVISGEGVLAGELRSAAGHAGYEVRSPHAPTGGVLPALVIDCDGETAAGEHGPGGEDRPGERREGPAGGARLLLCVSGSLGALDPAGSAVGFHVLPPLDEVKLIELTRNESSSPVAAARAERFFAALGKHTAWVGDAPGLVLGRIVCQIINECAFALGEGVGSAQDIDKGMLLGLSHPRGPLAWADTIGLDHVLGVLGSLCEEYREERYRPAPALRQLVHARRLGRASGAGFFDYELEG
jgi:3-hydroxybutyryl-CoA dehydrogenase